MKQGLGYVRHVQGIQPNVPAGTTCRHGLYDYGTGTFSVKIVF